MRIIWFAPVSTSSRNGGIERSRTFTRIWLALFDLWPWAELPVVPAELVFVPRRVPLNIYDFACWARQTVVALTIVSAYRPAHQLSFHVDELKCGTARPRESIRTWAGRFLAVDRVLHVYERRPIKFLRHAALRRAERWILQRQEADGSWGGIQPPWVYSLIALRLRGYGLDHPVMRAGISGLDGFTIKTNAGRRLEACQSPVWDTALAVTALADAGLSPEDPVLRSAARYLAWAKRSPCPATGRCVDPTSSRVAGPLSFITTTTPTSTTRPRCCWRSREPRSRSKGPIAVG